MTENNSKRQKKVLLLIDKYDQRPYIGGICVHNVAEALRHLDVETHVMAFKSESKCSKNEAQYVHYYSPGIIERLFLLAEKNDQKFIGKIYFRFAQFLSKTRKLIMFHWYPMDSVVLPRKIERNIEKLDYTYHFDAVVTVQSRISFSLAGYIWKKKHPGRTWMMYCIDSFADGYPIRFVPDKRRISGGTKIDLKLLEKVDQFYMVECHRKFYDQPLFDKYREKIHYVDIPLYIRKDESDQDCSTEKKTEEWIYAGSLHEFGYNPWKLCEYFLELPDIEHKRLTFYSRGNCEQKLAEISKHSEGHIVCKGYIPAVQLKEKLDSADVLVSIGIENSAQVSGKIFDYFCKYKKVVHFSSGASDPNMAYIERYPLSFCVAKDSDKEKTLLQLSEFLNNPICLNNEKKHEIDKLFLKSQPGYFAGLVCNYIDKKEECSYRGVGR